MRTSTSVRAHPATKGIFRSRFRAMADPMTFVKIRLAHNVESIGDRKRA